MGAYGFSDTLRANDIDDVIYDVTLRNVQHAASDVSVKYYNIYFLRYKRKID